MTTTRDELTLNIGNLIGQAANFSAEKWDYAGFMFEAEDQGGSSYLFKDGTRLSLNDDYVFGELRQNFLRLREVTRVDGDDYWIKCLAVVENESKQLRMLFEFNDQNRWKITPVNARDAYSIIIGDIFPEAIRN